MTDSHDPAGAASPAAGRPAASPSAGPPAMDPVAVIRSKPYLSALLLAAILGIPISAVAYGFLALVTKIQEFVFDDLPRRPLRRGRRPRGGRCPGWCCVDC